MNFYFYFILILLEVFLQGKCEIINKGDLYIKSNLKTDICEIIGKEAFLKCFAFKGPLLIASSVAVKKVLTENIEVH